MGAIYLGGGGSERDEAQLWDAAFATPARVVVWPFAHRATADREAAGEWFTQALGQRGLVDIETWTEAESHSPRELDRVDVVAIPGGNTFDLLHTLLIADLLPLLTAFLDRGGRAYGGSAGAVLMGADIGIASVADANDVRLRRTGGLNLVAGLDVLPHYTAGHAGFARDHHRDHGRAVLCIPQSGGVVVTGGTGWNPGPSAVHVITATTTATYRQGDRWELTAPQGA